MESDSLMKPTHPSSTNELVDLESQVSSTECKKYIRCENSQWSIEEEYLFFESQSLLGNKWTSLCQLFPNKSPKQLKNHFYSCIIKTIRKIVKQKRGCFSLSVSNAEVKEIIIAYYSLSYLRQIFSNKHYLLILQKKAYKCKKKKNVTLKKLILAHDLSFEMIEAYYKGFEEKALLYLSDVYAMKIAIGIPQFFKAIVKRELISRSHAFIRDNALQSQVSIETLQKFIQTNSAQSNINALTAN